MKPKLLGTTRLASHEFWRALRVNARHAKPLELLEKLVLERSKSLRSFVTTLLVCLVAQIAMDEGTTLSVKIPYLEFVLPGSLVMFVSCAALLTAELAVINYFFLNEFLRLAANRLFRFDNAPALTVHIDGQSAWSLGLMPQFRFLKSPPSHSRLGLGVAYILQIVVAFPLIYANVIVLYNARRLWWSIPHDWSIATITNFIALVGSCIMLVLPLTLLWVIKSSFLFSKNEFYIRWNFLFRAFDRGYRPSIDRWLDEANANKGP